MRTTVILVLMTLAVASFGPLKSTALSQPDVISLGKLPSFYMGGENYKADPYIAAAAKLRAAGKDKAAKALLINVGENKIILGESTFILCRMLFTAKPKKDFRRPFIGAPACLGGTSAEDWPLEPIEIVDGVPFLVVRGYNIGGLPEFYGEYLDYCLKECDWGTTDFRPKTAAEKKKALEKLLASPKWKKPLDDEEKAFLSSQIK